MENIVLEMAIEVIVGIIIPIIAAGSFAIRYFLKKEKCFTLMKEKINNLSKSDDTSHNTHSTLYDKINKLENRSTALESKLDLIINHLGINPK